jgi:hypothetical protein
LIFLINFFALTIKIGSQPKKLWYVSVGYSYKLRLLDHVLQTVHTNLLTGS